MKANHETTPATRALTITRFFNAPLKLVWRAWTEPEHLKKWWGPKDFTCPVGKIDFRVGGSYHYCMRGADGQEFWSGGVYNEIVPMKKISCTDHFSDEKGNKVSAKDMGMPGENWPDEMQVIITFEEIGGKTKMTLQHIGLPDGETNEMTNAGWNQSFDKLEASLK